MAARNLINLVSGRQQLHVMSSNNQCTDMHTPSIPVQYQSCQSLHA
jgi:hypothetical protein